MPNRTFVILVHGTFATNAEWARPDSAFCRALKAQVSLSVEFVPHTWTGGNSHVDRHKAAQELAKRVRLIRDQSKDHRVFIIGHSHGGTIALLSQQYEQADGVVCMASPFLEARPRFSTRFLSTISKLSAHFGLAIAIGFALVLLLVGYPLSEAFRSPVILTIFLSVIALGEALIFHRMDDVKAWCHKQAEALINWFEDQYSSANLEYVYAASKARVLILWTRFDEARLGLGTVSILSRLADAVRTFAQEMTASFLRIAPWLFVAIVFLSLISVLIGGKDFNPTLVPERIALAVLFAGFVCVLSSLVLFLACEMATAVVFLPFQSAGFGFEGWKAFFLYRFKVRLRPFGLQFSKLKDILLRGRHPGKLRHSAIYEEAACISEIGMWLVTPEVRKHEATNTFENWWETENLQRRCGRISAVLGLLTTWVWFYFANGTRK